MPTLAKTPTQIFIETWGNREEIERVWDLWRRPKKPLGPRPSTSTTTAATIVRRIADDQAIAQEAANPRDQADDVRRRTGGHPGPRAGRAATTLYGSMKHGDSRQAIPPYIAHRYR